MTKQGKLAILGGDDRQRYMPNTLRANGWEVASWGINLREDTPNWESAVEGADAILLPLPASEDGVRIRTSLENSPRFATLLQRLDPRACRILGGKLPKAWIDLAVAKGFDILDYFDSEALQMRNALPTVEGAIYLALSKLPVTLCGNKVAVLGYGRIASLLAERLLALGAHVTVYARKERDLAHAEIRGLTARQLRGEGDGSSLCEIPWDCRVIFNTIPSRILSSEILEHLPRGCILMELASFPGGFDFPSAERAGLCPLLASALPGKLFPESAGKILAQTVSEILLTPQNTP